MPKRHNDNQPIKNVLQQFVDDNNLQQGLNNVNVKEAWVSLMGNGVNNYTTALELKNNTLYVKLSSSVLREELSYGKDKIIKLLNETLGNEVIKKVVLQ